MATVRYLTYDGLEKYHGLITNYIDTADAKAIKYAAIEDGYLLLYKTENPEAGAEPDFRLAIEGVGYDVITDEEIEEIFGVSL